MLENDLLIVLNLSVIFLPLISCSIRNNEQFLSIKAFVMIAHTPAIATSGIFFPRHGSIFFFLTEEVIYPSLFTVAFSLTCVLFESQDKYRSK